MQPLAVTLHADSVQPQVCRLHVEMGVTFLPWGAPGHLPARPLSSYPPAVGPQAACSPHPCPFLGPLWEPPGWRQTGDLPRLPSLQKAGDRSAPRPSLPEPHPQPHWACFCARGPVVGAGRGPPPVQSPGEQGGSWVTLVPSREGGPSGETPHPGRVQTLDSSPPTEAKP